MMVGAMSVEDEGVALLGFCMVRVGIAMELEIVFCVIMVEVIVGMMRAYEKLIDEASFLNVFAHEKCKRWRTWAAISED